MSSLPRPDRPAEPVTLHSSWRGITLSFLGAGLLLFAGLLGGIFGRWGIPSIVMTAVGAIAFLGVLFDYPIAVTFDGDGLVRRAMLRRQRLAWSEITHLSRTRPGFSAVVRRISHGGLVAVVGRRRYLLVDQLESGDEHDRIEAVVEQAPDAPNFDTVPRPPDGVTPTWVYRRARWDPSGDERR